MLVIYDTVAECVCQSGGSKSGAMKPCAALFRPESRYIGNPANRNTVSVFGSLPAKANYFFKKVIWLLSCWPTLTSCVSACWRFIALKCGLPTRFSRIQSRANVPS